MIDGDCIFLLCTDGLSDFDRVEQNWRSKILPVLEGNQDLPSAVKDLVSIANQQNGHDNVTVALVHCQVEPLAESPLIKVAWSDVEFAISESSLWSDTNLTNAIVTDSNPTEEIPPAETEIPEQPIGEPLIGESLIVKRQPTWLKPLILLLIVSLVAGLVTLFLVQQTLKKQDNSNPTPDTQESELTESDQSDQ